MAQKRGCPSNEDKVSAAQARNLVMTVMTVMTSKGASPDPSRPSQVRDIVSTKRRRRRRTRRKKRRSCTQTRISGMETEAKNATQAARTTSSGHLHRGSLSMACAKPLRLEAGASFGAARGRAGHESRPPEHQNDCSEYTQRPP
ncbi:hypothetical protein VTH06DRAFT_7013 [Thermothelomyces fergusii]